MSDVFIQHDPQPEPGFNIGVVLRRQETKGAVGIEIEVEGNKFPKPQGFCHQALPFHGMWSACKDGSLRGQDNAEYVLTRPIEFDEVARLHGEQFAHGEFGPREFGHQRDFGGLDLARELVQLTDRPLERCRERGESRKLRFDIR